MKEVFTPEMRTLLGALLTDCQKRVRVNCRPLCVADICHRLSMSTATFYKLREA